MSLTTWTNTLAAPSFCFELPVKMSPKTLRLCSILLVLEESLTLFLLVLSKVPIFVDLLCLILPVLFVLPLLLLLLLLLLLVLVLMDLVLLLLLLLLLLLFLLPT